MKLILSVIYFILTKTKVSPRKKNTHTYDGQKVDDKQIRKNQPKKLNKQSKTERVISKILLR